MKEDENMKHIEEIVKRGIDKIETEQRIDELTWFAKELAKTKPTFGLEIGIYKGGTRYVWERICKELITIDICPDYRPTITGDARDLETVEKLKQFIGDRKFDFIFLDGDHMYEGVYKEFLFYSQFVKDGGIIAFHDIYILQHDCEVPVLWERIKNHTFSDGTASERNFKQFEYKSKLKQFPFLEGCPDGPFGIGYIIWEKSAVDTIGTISPQI